MLLLPYGLTAEPEKKTDEDEDGDAEDMLWLSKYFRARIEYQAREKGITLVKDGKLILPEKLAAQ